METFKMEGIGGKRLEKMVLENLISKSNVPITFRNAFKQYLKWREEYDLD
jgi:hypothetical protein